MWRVKSNNLILSNFKQHKEMVQIKRWRPCPMAGRQTNPPINSAFCSTTGRAVGKTGGLDMLEAFSMRKPQAYFSDPVVHYIPRVARSTAPPPATLTTPSPPAEGVVETGDLVIVFERISSVAELVSPPIYMLRCQRSSRWRKRSELVENIGYSRN